jgi:hypothetical protein
MRIENKIGFVISIFGFGFFGSGVWRVEIRGVRRFAGEEYLYCGDSYRREYIRP